MSDAALLHRYAQPSDLLSQWPWDDLSHDPFALFALRQQILQVLIGSTNGPSMAVHEDHLKHKWVTTAIHQLFDHNPNDDNAVKMYLEIFHGIFKDFRKCDLAQDHVGYVLFSGWIHHPNISTWLSFYLQERRHDSLALVPLLFCLNDITKIARLSHGEELYPNEVQVTLDLLAIHLQEICSLWQHTSISVVRRSLEIIARLLRCPMQVDKMQTVLDLLLVWKEHLQEHITADDFWSLFEPERTEFYYERIGDGQITVDRECLKLGIQVLVSSLLYLSGCPHVDSDTQHVFGQLENSITVLRQDMSDLQVLEAVLEIYGSNDEDAVNLQLDVLKMFKNLDRRTEMDSFKRSFMRLLETTSPNRLFLWFCQRTGMDHELLVDLLLSDETDFLQLFVDYLKHVEKNPDDFVNCCCDILEQDIQSAMGMLYRLVNVLKTGGFPYNPSYLIHRLELVLKLIRDAAVRLGHL